MMYELESFTFCRLETPEMVTLVNIGDTGSALFSYSNQSEKEIQYIFENYPL